MNEPSRNEFTYDDLEPHAPSLGCLVVLPNPICSTGPHRAGNQFHRRRASPCSPPCPTDNTSYSPPPPYTSNNQPRSQTEVHSQAPNMFFNGSFPATVCSHAARNSGKRHSRRSTAAQAISTLRKTPLIVRSTSMQKPPPSDATPSMPAGQDTGAVVGIERAPSSAP